MAADWNMLRELAENLEIPEGSHPKAQLMGRHMLDAYSSFRDPRLAQQRIEDLRRRVIHHLPDFAYAATRSDADLPEVRDRWGMPLSVDDAHERLERFLKISPVIWWDLSVTELTRDEVMAHLGKMLARPLQHYGFDPHDQAQLDSLNQLLEQVTDGLSDPPDLEQLRMSISMQLGFRRAALLHNQPRDDAMPELDAAPLELSEMVVRNLRALRDMPLAYIDHLTHNPAMYDHNQFVTWGEPDEDGIRSGDFDRYRLFEQLDEAYPALVYLGRLEAAYGLQYEPLSKAYEHVVRCAAALHSTLEDWPERAMRGRQNLIETNLRETKAAIATLADMGEKMLATPVFHGDDGEITAEFLTLLGRDIRRICQWAVGREPHDPPAAGLPDDPLENSYRMELMSSQWHYIRNRIRDAVLGARYMLGYDAERKPLLTSGGVAIPLETALSYPGLRFDQVMPEAIEGLRQAFANGPMTLDDIGAVLNDQAALLPRDDKRNHGHLLRQQLIEAMAVPGYTMAVLDQLERPVAAGENSRLRPEGAVAEMREDLRRDMPRKHMWEDTAPSYFDMRRLLEQDNLKSFIGSYGDYQGRFYYDLRRDLYRIQHGEEKPNTGSLTEMRVMLDFLDTLLPGGTTRADLRQIRSEVNALTERFFGHVAGPGVAAYR